MKRVFALIDCNNFFVSCERVFRPDLWNRPVAVLSNNDGCIVARSNEVKALGVPMGVPYFKVKELLKAHKVTLFSGNFRLYGDFSQRVVRVLQNACADIEVYSVDESFLRLDRLPVDNYEAWATQLRQRLLLYTGIPVSIGIASTKTLAKAAAEYAKQDPRTDGIYSLLPEDREKQHHLLMWLPVGDIWGVGRRTAPKLQAYGISTARQLIQTSDQWVQAQLGIRGLKIIKELRGESCYGLENSNEPQQSIACTRSFGHTIRDYYQLEGAVATFAARAAAKLRTQEEVAQALAVFLRLPKRFEMRGVSTVARLMQPTADTGVIIEVALQALQRLYDPELAYSKAGVVLIDLVSVQAQQLTFLQGSANQLDRQAALMRTVDELNQRYAARLVRHASEHLERTEWHSQHQLRSPAYTTQWRELPRVRA